MCGGIVSSMGVILDNLAEDFLEGIKWMGKCICVGGTLTSFGKNNGKELNV